LDRFLREKHSAFDIPKVDEVLGKLAESHKLTDHVWLSPGVAEVGLAPIQGDGKALRTGVTIKARPRLSIGKELPAGSVPKLRPSAPAAGRLHGDLSIDAQWAEGKLREVLGEACRKLLGVDEVSGVKLAGVRGELVATVALDRIGVELVIRG